MPRIPATPQYQPLVKTPQAGPVDVSSPGTFLPFVGAASETGRMMQARGEQLLREYDETRAIGAYNKLRELSRSKVAELLTREGKDAQGAQQEFGEWYRRAFDDVAKKELTVHSQRETYQRIADQRKQGDLDQLAHHEAQQHTAYKKQVIAGMAETVERDIRNTAFDQEQSDAMILDHFAAMDNLYPGRDLSVDKMASLQKFRVAQAQELIDKDAAYAAKWIEQKYYDKDGKETDSIKNQLGEKYYIIKDRLEKQGKSNRLEAAYTVLLNQFGGNHYKASAYVNNPANWTKLGGIKYEEAKELDNRFTGMARDREQIEDRGRKLHDEAVKQNDLQVLVALGDPSVANKPDVFALGRQRLVSDSLLRWHIQQRESPQADNWETVVAINERVNIGEDATEDLRTAVVKGLISQKTAAAIGKHMKDEEYKRAAAQMDRALKPSEFDKWSKDKNLRHAEAYELFWGKMASGKKPLEAATEVIEQYLGSMSRSAKMLGRPRNLQGAIDDPAALSAAKQATVQDLQTGRISAEEYKAEMNRIERLEDNARDKAQASEASGELSELLKKRQK